MAPLQSTDAPMISGCSLWAVGTAAAEGAPMLAVVSWAAWVRLELVESKHVPFSDPRQKLEELAALVDSGVSVLELLEAWSGRSRFGVELLKGSPELFVNVATQREEALK